MSLNIKIKRLNGDECTESEIAVSLQAIGAASSSVEANRSAIATFLQDTFKPLNTGNDDDAAVSSSIMASIENAATANGVVLNSTAQAAPPNGGISTDDGMITLKFKTPLSTIKEYDVSKDISVGQLKRIIKADQNLKGDGELRLFANRYRLPDALKLRQAGVGEGDTIQVRWAKSG